MAKPGERAYREQRNKDLSAYYRRAANKRSFLFQRFLAFLAPIVLRILQTKIEGREHLPAQGPYILAGSHFSVYDPLFLSFADGRPPIRFVAKSQLFTWLRGWLFLLIGALPIRRGHNDRQAFRACQQILSRGQCLLIFPQGGVHQQLTVNSARWGAGLVAQQNDVPVIPALIRHSGLWGHTVIFGPAIDVEHCQSPSPADNQRVAEQIMSQIIILDQLRKEKDSRP